MARLAELDEHVTFSEQIEENVRPIVLINRFDVKPEEADQFIRAWQKDAIYFKGQPGFISAHSSIEELAVVAYSSTTQFGNLLYCTRRPLVKLTYGTYYRITPLVQLHHLTYSGKSRSQESVGIKFLSGAYDVYEGRTLRYF
jgi:hypothetical protein